VDSTERELVVRSTVHSSPSGIGDGQPDLMPLRRLALALLPTLIVPAPLAANDATVRPVATYSIVARDAGSGNLGVAVQSHWFSVGSVVSWAEPGVGAVATQSFVEVSYGPLGLKAMGEGESAEQALTRLLAADPHPEVRQVAFVDAAGRVAVHTGGGCIPAAGHRSGDGYSVQANLMLGDEVPDAMARAYESASGPLAERMLAALDAAQRVGGDLRGRQSAALLVVRSQPSGESWHDRLIDLRVEDHEHPLAELRRLLRLHRAYAHMNRGDEAVAGGDLKRALAEYETAEQMFPNNDEFIFWHAVTLVANGRLDESLPLFARAFRMNPSWMLLVPRLVSVGQLPAEEGLTERIRSVGPRSGTEQK
jgi:uncharacterized Ntn-hydrolase superfamily protein